MTVFSQPLPLRGDLQIIRRNAYTREIQSIWEKKNVITYAGTDALIKLMAPNSALGEQAQMENQIRSMRFGTNSTLPQRTDTNLMNEGIVGGVPIRVELGDSARILGAAGTVDFIATLAADMGNGLIYREAGLFTRGTADNPQQTSGSVLFSRQVYPDQPKNASVELEFRWRITFTV